MKVHKVGLEEFSNDDYALIGFQSTLQSFQLAYLLNKNLGILLARTDNDLDFNTKRTKSCYSVYEYINNKLDRCWFLISNVSKIEVEFTGLFSKSEVKTYLIPEKKELNYFLKLEGNFTNNFITEIKEILDEIPQIKEFDLIEVKTLKSKHFLIF